MPSGFNQVLKKFTGGIFSSAFKKKEATVGQNIAALARQEQLVVENKKKEEYITVKKTNSMIPSITEFDNNVSNTFIPTFPHNIVVRRKFESSLNFAIFNACLLFFLDSISSSNLLILKKARLRPENIAD